MGNQLIRLKITLLTTVFGGLLSISTWPQIAVSAENDNMGDTMPMETAPASMENSDNSALTTSMTSEQADNIRTDSPDEYIVKKGDTLWGISGKFLNDPWFWPELWDKNPQIANPHLIYPGDIISLIYVDGQPQLQITRVDGATATHSGQTATPQGVTTSQADEGQAFERVHKEGPLKMVKLSPRIHKSSLAESIPTIPNDAVEQFTARPQVISIEEWENAPYIVASDDEHLILGTNNRIYIRGELDKEKLRYNIYRKGDKLKDPVTEELLGYEVKYAGEVVITAYDDPASGRISNATREVILGDRLLPVDTNDLNSIYFPKPPENVVKGQIISLYDAIYGVAQYQVAVINLGRRDGLAVGHILASYSQGRIIRDTDPSNEGDLKVKLPNERSGIMMIFKVFDRVSYGLIIDATRVIRKFDEIRTPYK